MFDEGITAIWDAIDPSDRTPGVHIMTGPIEVIGAQPGESILVRILEMTPRVPFGSNCAANWGLLYDRFGKERITIYGLNDLDAGRFRSLRIADVRLRLHRTSALRRPGGDLTTR